MQMHSYKIAAVIDEIAMGPFGSNVKVECFVDDGIPILNGSNLEGFVLNDASFRFLTEEKAASLGRANAARGDVVITHRGTLGQIVYIPHDSKYERYVISQSQFRLRCNELVMPEYLVFYFHTRQGQHKILSNASQVGVPALARPTSTFQHIDIELPIRDVQEKIVSIILSIQNKIALNQKINANLQAQAAAVFCDSFKGCADGTLSDICEYSTDRVAVSELNLDNYFSTENMLPDKQGVSQASGLPTTAQTPRCSVGDVLVSNIRPYFKKIYYCHEDGGCSADVLCFRPKHEELSAFLFYALYDDSFFDFMMAGSKGTKMPRGDRKQIMTYPIAMPSDEELASFNALARPMIETIKTNAQVSKHLAAIRDALLPRLMSGEIDVSGIELGHQSK